MGSSQLRRPMRRDQPRRLELWWNTCRSDPVGRSVRRGDPRIRGHLRLVSASILAVNYGTQHHHEYSNRWHSFHERVNESRHAPLPARATLGRSSDVPALREGGPPTPSRRGWRWGVNAVGDNPSGAPVPDMGYGHCSRASGLRSGCGCCNPRQRRFWYWLIVKCRRALMPVRN